MVAPIANHREPQARSSTDGWGLLVCELLTLAALVASLVSMAPAGGQVGVPQPPQSAVHAREGAYAPMPPAHW
jgi:hypothetical protein